MNTNEFQYHCSLSLHIFLIPAWDQNPLFLSPVQLCMPIRMNGMPPDSNSLPLMEDTEKQTDQTLQTTPQSSELPDQRSPSQNFTCIGAFLRINAFVVLTVAAVVIGKWFHETHWPCIPHYCVFRKLKLCLSMSLCSIDIKSSWQTWQTSWVMHLQCVPPSLYFSKGLVWAVLCAPAIWQPGTSNTSPFLESFWWECCRCWCCPSMYPVWLQVRSLSTQHTLGNNHPFKMLKNALIILNLCTQTLI